MKKMLIPIILILLLLTAVLVAAQGGFDIPRWSVDGGASTSSGDEYTMNGIIGQPDAGVVMGGGEFSVSDGYWGSSAGGTAGQYFKLFLPVVLR